ncbi:MAG: efflux RND transporter periplasmic adaptor subunit [Wenzhouxiangellaceae bacterium]
MKRFFLLCVVIIIAALAGFGLAWWMQSDNADDDSNTIRREILYWAAPMDPSYRSDKPGKSPMGMDLVPVYADDQDSGDSDQPALRISPVVINNIGVKTATAQNGTLYREIETVGFITPDADRIEHVHMRTEGWIERLVTDTEGDKVNSGKVLFEIYSPALVSAQDEYLQAVRNGSELIIRAARSRLRALGMVNDQIEQLHKRGRVQELFQELSPMNGYVLSLDVREGMFVQPGITVMSLADLTTIWVDVDVFENQIDWVKTGQTAEMRLPFAPDRVWRGQVDYVYPTIRAETRSARVRLTFDNRDLTLKPNMYAKVNILAEPRTSVVTVPAQAVIRTGDEERVILALGDGYFRPAQVHTGLESGGRVEILEGLTEGEQIVISSQFLMDSEASMDASLLRMIGQEQEATEQAGDGMQGIDHSGHDMGSTDSGGESQEIDHSGHDMQGMDDGGEGQ